MTPTDEELFWAFAEALDAPVSDEAALKHGGVMAARAAAAKRACADLGAREAERRLAKSTELWKEALASALTFMERLAKALRAAMAHAPAGSAAERQARHALQLATSFMNTGTRAGEHAPGGELASLSEAHRAAPRNGQSGGNGDGG